MIVTDKGTLDVENARVAAVGRRDGELRICFENARLMRPGSDTFEPCIATLALAGVSSESADYCVGHKVSAPHPDPEKPLDRVEVVAYSGGRLNLQGMRFNEPWYEWDIVSQSVSLESVTFAGNAAQPVVAADVPSAARR